MADTLLEQDGLPANWAALCRVADAISGSQTDWSKPGAMPPEPPQARFKRNHIADTIKCSMYFLAGAGLIKIGITTNLTSRIRAIRNSSPVPLELLATMSQAGNWEEGRMHDRFRALRRHGEWFEDDGAIRAYVDDLVERHQAVRPK